MSLRTHLLGMGYSAALWTGDLQVQVETDSVRDFDLALAKSLAQYVATVVWVCVDVCVCVYRLLCSARIRRPNCVCMCAYILSACAYCAVPRSPLLT